MKSRWILACAALLAGAACAALHRPPAVQGLPVDDPEVAFSAVWIGHATVLLRFGGVHLLTDPNFAGTLYVVPRDTPPSATVRELPFVHAAIASHMHFDHFDRPTLHQLLPTTALFYPAGGEPYAGSLPQRRREALAPWQKVEVSGVSITAVPVQHFGGRYGIDSAWNDAYSGYVIEGAGRTVFFAGDTGYHPEMFKEIGARFPGIDVAFVPIAPYRGSTWGNPKHANPTEALAIFRDVGARFMIPIHFEAYYGNWSGYDTPREDLVRSASWQGLTDRVYALFPGERFLLPDEAHVRPRVSREVKSRGLLSSW
ncbi:MBL fold metallo-hydrolase [Vulgatibacter sp.]|uniref:MBL fold metallo-hydrolase n=1 Tax=Vulgatibacter sp. TaxID=1971226 RepID=UPI003564011B